jgi:hypothetical protein
MRIHPEQKKAKGFGSAASSPEPVVDGLEEGCDPGKEGSYPQEGFYRSTSPPGLTAIRADAKIGRMILITLSEA